MVGKLLRLRHTAPLSVHQHCTGRGDGTEYNRSCPTAQPPNGAQLTPFFSYVAYSSDLRADCPDGRLLSCQFYLTRTSGTVHCQANHGQVPPISHDMELAFQKLSADEKGRTNWQYQGYPGLSRWMASASDFLVLKRFSPLQVRCLLSLQGEIARMEHQIEAWDIYAQKQPQATGGGMNGSLGNDPYEQRAALIRQVTPMLDQYSMRLRGVQWSNAD